MKYKLYFLILCLLLSVAGISTKITAADNRELKVYVNAVQMSFPDQKPIINCDNRTLIPVRFVSEALGGKVEWNSHTTQVKIQHEGKSIVLNIGEKQALIGDNSIMLDTSADIVNNRTLVPLRFIGECLGAEVQWNGEKGEIYISTKMPPANPFIGQPFKPSDLPCLGGITNKTIIAGSNEQGAQIMYAKIEQLPIKVGFHAIYSLSVDKTTINIQQQTDDSNCFPILMYMVENNQLNRFRGYCANEKGKTFTYSYPIFSTLDNTPTNITKVSDFALFDYDGLEFRMLVIPNPAYEK